MPSTLVAIESIAQEPAIVVAKHPYDTELGLSGTPSPPRPSTSGGRDSPPPYDSKVDAGYM